MSFVTADIFSFIRRNIKYKQKARWDSPNVIESITHKWTDFFLEVVNEYDTYVVIFTKDFSDKNECYKNAYEWFVQQPEVKLLYQSPPAINTKYSNTQLRNFVVVFEWQEPPPVQNAEKTEKTQEETTLSPSVTEENTASPVDTTEIPELAQPQQDPSN